MINAMLNGDTKSDDSIGFNHNVYKMLSEATIKMAKGNNEDKIKQNVEKMFAECKRLAEVAKGKDAKITSFLEKNDKINDLVEM